jgi:outer membrane protein TolC
MTLPSLLLVLAQVPTAGATYTEAQAVERALVHSPLLKAKDDEVDEASAWTDVATRWSNPQLRISKLRYDQLVEPAVQGRTYGDHPFQKTSIGIRWDPPALGQRSARTAEARVREVKAAAERVQSRRDTAALVRTLHASVVNLDAEIELEKSALAGRERLRDLVHKRVEEQAATRLDESLADVDYLEVATRLGELEEQRRQDYASLLAQLELPPDAVVTLLGDSGDGCKQALESRDLEERAERANPWADMVAQEIKAADTERSRRLWVLLPWPDYLQASYVMAGDNQPGYFTFELGLTLPLLDWKRGERRAFAAKHRALVEELRAQNRALADRLRRTASAQAAQAFLVRRYHDSAAEIDQGLTLLHRSLENGESTNLLQVEHVQTRLFAAQRSALQAQLDCKLRQIDLDRLTGTEL